MDKPKWNLLKAPDFNLNGGFLSETHASSGCPGVMAVPSIFWGQLITSVLSWLICVKFRWITNVSRLDVDKDKGKEQGRCKTRQTNKTAVFEQEQNAKQATESHPAERAELETLAGTTQAAHRMWPELQPTYGVFSESSDPEDPHGRKKNHKSFINYHNSHFGIFGRTTNSIWDVPAGNDPRREEK